MTSDDLDKFTRHYLIAALWSSNDESNESGGEPLDRNYDLSDLSEDTLEWAVVNCAKFQAECDEMISEDLTDSL